MTCVNCKCNKCVGARESRLNNRLSWRKKYPWETWFNGDEHLLIRGFHFFDVTAKQMRHVAYESAKRRGFKIQTSVDGDTVRLRAVASCAIPFRCLSVEKQRAVAIGGGA